MEPRAAVLKYIRDVGRMCGKRAHMFTSVRTGRVFGLGTGNGKSPFGGKIPAGKRETGKKFREIYLFLNYFFYS